MVVVVVVVCRCVGIKCGDDGDHAEDSSVSEMMVMASEGDGE